MVEMLKGRVAKLVPMRSAGALAALVAGLLLFGAAPSLATWSTPRSVNSPGGSLATDGRGDVALAWEGGVRRCSHSRCTYEGLVKVAFGRSTGPLVTHTVWRHANASAYGVTVVLDARGELTVAWVDAHPNIDGQHTVRSAFRTLAGHWSAVQAVGDSSRLNPLLPEDYVDPRLAVAPDREVLLTWNAGEVFKAPGRLAQAWRRPGHCFGPTAEYRLNGAGMGDQTPVFDSGGSAHVYGVLTYTPPHGRSGSNAVMLSTAAHSHRFGAPVVVAPSGGALVVSFSAAGQAIAAWLNPAGQLQPPASPYARVMLHGTLGAPVRLPSYGTKAVTAVAANGGGGSVGWVPEPVSAAPDSVMVATADASGRFSPRVCRPTASRPRPATEPATSCSGNPTCSRGATPSPALPSRARLPCNRRTGERSSPRRCPGLSLRLLSLRFEPSSRPLSRWAAVLRSVGRSATSSRSRPGARSSGC